MGLHQITHSPTYIEKAGCKETADQHIFTNRRLKLPITKQTFNKKNQERVIDD